MPGVTIYEPASHTYFSPNGDGQEDTGWIYYCLDESSNVTITVSSADRLVRTVEAGVSHAGSTNCSGWNNYTSWDGKDESGTVVPDGLYSVHVHTVNATGDSADDSVEVGIETRAPGSLTTPAPNDTLSGTVNWTFTPTTGFDVYEVDLSCAGGFLGYTTTAGSDGTFSNSGDTAQCNAGTNALTASAYWTDPFGGRHAWTALPVPVTIDNPPQVSISSNSHRYFSPNADTQDDTLNVYYCLSRSASVGFTVVNPTGTIVRTVDATPTTGGTNCYGWNSHLTWDGKDDAGQVVPDAIYTLRITATDSSGRTAEDTVQVGVDTRAPGALTAPAQDATLSGTANWTFTPNAAFDLYQVDVYCDGSYLGSATSTAPDGTYSGSGDTSHCKPGANALTATTSWTDAFGSHHSWSSRPLLVTIDNPPQVTISGPYSHRYFSPNGDGQDDDTEIYFCLSKNATVTITVADSTSALVRTLESAANRVGGNNCGPWNNFLPWDGKNDAGTVVPDGIYTLRVHAVDASARSAHDTVDIGVDVRNPGVLTAPVANAALTGTVNWTVTPTAGFNLNSVAVYCVGTWLGDKATADPDGSFTGSGDSTGCRAGTNSLTAVISWSDAFGNYRSWSTPPTVVTIGNAPSTSIYDPYSRRYFSPNGDGQDDATTVYYCLSADATVDVTITNSVGATIRTLEPAARTGIPGCGTWNNYFSWDGADDTGKTVADGVYTVRLHAVDSAGKTGDDTVEIGVDTRTPGSMTAPKPGDTLAGLATLAFQPTSGYPVSQVSAYFNTGGGATIYNASPDGSWRTSLYAGTLQSGPATLQTVVSSIDPFGVGHSWVATDVPVVVDVTALPLTVAATPATGPAPLQTTLHIETSDPAARTVHYSVNFGDGGSGASGDVAAPYTPVEVPHTYANPGVYRAVVVVTNSAGAASTRAIDIPVAGTANTAPTAGLSLDTAAGMVPLPIVATIAGTDAENDPLTYKLDFGDGTGAAGGSLPQAPISHTYTRAGTYLVRLAVGDGKLTTVRTATVVAALSGPLTANAGDDQVVTLNSAVHLDGSASLPSAGIEAYRWTFGDGSSTSEAVADHTYAAVGTYTAKLTVTSNGQTSEDTAIVAVKEPPTESGLVVAVQDEGNNPLPDTELVVIDSAGQKYSAHTDQSGAGHLHGLADGSYAVYGWKSGYVPASTTAAVNNDAGTAKLTLKQGQVATASLTSTPLTYDQIVAAGIDPDDPANQLVEQFTVNLAVGPSSTSFRGYAATGGFPVCPTADGIEVTCKDSTARIVTNEYVITVHTSYTHGQPQLVWLVIPAKASWLKEFFSIQMMVTNLADPAFVLDHGSATLPLPSGLSLAPTGSPQTQTVSMPDIPGGSSATATWVVRGDTEGFYDLTSSYAAGLEPFGDTITVNAATPEPLHVWGKSAIEITVDADNDLWDRDPYHVRVGLKNVADVPIYNAAVELLSQGKEHYLYQPREALRQTTAQIDPGATFWTDDYILAPDISGTLNLATTFITQATGAEGPTPKITTHAPQQTPATAPLLTASGLKDRVGLKWESVPGATGYEIYSTPDRITDFPAAPVQTLPADATTTTIPLAQGSEAWFAVSTIVNGRRTLLHPIVDATPSTEAIEPRTRVKLSSTASCGADVSVSASFDDAFADLTGWTATLDGADYATGGNHALSGRHGSASFTVNAAQIKAEGSVLRVKATDTVGTGPMWTASLSKACGGIKMVVLGDSIAWGQGLLDDKKYPALVSTWITGKTGRAVEYRSWVDNVAHSGANVNPNAGCSPDVAASLGYEAGQEVPTSTPDIGKCQAGTVGSTAADLILVDGCINDINVVNILLNPLTDLYTAVQDKCGKQVTDLLLKLHADHPSAQIVYTGYYPIIDQTLSPTQLLQLARTFGISQAAAAGLTSEFLKARSSTFDNAFRLQATASVNNALAAQPGTWLVFADPTFVTGDGLFDSNSKLYAGANDPMWVDRAVSCVDAAPILRSTAFDKGKCLVASMGHPNEAGAQVYANAIETALSHWAAGIHGTTPVKTLAIAPSTVSLAKGDSKALSVTATYADGTTGDASSMVTLSSDKPGTVSVDGLTVKGVSVGQAQITATLTGNPAIKTTIIVNVRAVEPRSLVIAPAAPLVTVGGSVQLAATVTMSDGTVVAATSKSTWTSSRSAVATVNAKGVLKGVDVGTASIAASYRDAQSSVTITGSTTASVLAGPPKITGFTPISGRVGAQVTIQGTSLLGASSVTFGSVPAVQFTVNSSTSITAIVPSGAKTAAISVTTPLGTAKSKGKFTVR
ncbi:PKD domain-containing protein [Kribbella sp. VKM Ac-2566]|uniref:PKD domain-containing protein n=1 Tax=Kribbella sp. VKM Ac-2566 TaxID=2512218 RepID=UPI001416FE33|nr:PKD domain-containing protein [Kribbella sp. VKM Ac-2566]